MMKTKMMLILFVGIVILSCTTNQVLAQDPEITENILPEIRRLGTTGRLNCTVINQQLNPVNWIQTGTGMMISKNDKILLEDEINMLDDGRYKFQVFMFQLGERVTYQLVVNSLERKDHGLYTCKIHIIGSDQQPSKDGEMIVLSPPSVFPSETTFTITKKAGEPLNLTCDADGYPTPNITWVRVSGGLLPTDELRHTNKTLFIQSVAAEDRGIYRCLADNAVRPPAVHDATLLVFFRPVAHAIQDSYGQATGRGFQVNLECRIAGYPEPDLQWFQISDNGEWTAINEDHKHAILILLNHANILGSQERWFQMLIRTFTANDLGTYACRGRNAYGEDHAIITVFETSECQGPNCPDENPISGKASTMTSSLFVYFLLFIIAAVMQT